jgi:hypothetical protein
MRKVDMNKVAESIKENVQKVRNDMFDAYKRGLGEPTTE